MGTRSRLLRGGLRTLQNKKKQETIAFATDAEPRDSTICMLLNPRPSTTNLCRAWTQSCAGFFMLPSFPIEISPSVSEQLGTRLCSSCKGSWQSKFSGFHLKSKKMPNIHYRVQATSAVPRQKGSSESGARAHGGGVTPKLLFHGLGGNYRNREGKTSCRSS